MDHSSMAAVVIPCYSVARIVMSDPIQQTAHQEIVFYYLHEWYNLFLLLRVAGDGMCLGSFCQDFVFRDMVERCQLLNHLLR